MKNKFTNPAIADLRDKEEKNTSRAIRTESIKMALATTQDGGDPIKHANRIYKFIEYGVVELTEEEVKKGKNVKLS